MKQIERMKQYISTKYLNNGWFAAGYILSVLAIDMAYIFYCNDLIKTFPIADIVAIVGMLIITSFACYLIMPDDPFSDNDWSDE